MYFQVLWYSLILKSCVVRFRVGFGLREGGSIFSGSIVYLPISIVTQKVVSKQKHFTYVRKEARYICMINAE